MIFTQGEEKKFFVSTMGSVVTQHSARPEVIVKSFHNFAYFSPKCRSLPKSVRLQHFPLYHVEISRVGWWTRCHEMSLSIKRLIHFSLLNHWRSTASNYYSFHQLRPRDRSVGVGVKTNENKYFLKTANGENWSRTWRLIYFLPTTFFLLHESVETKKSLRKDTLTQCDSEEMKSYWAMNGSRAFSHEFLWSN